jgi:hypothetical protein
MRYYQDSLSEGIILQLGYAVPKLINKCIEVKASIQDLDHKVHMNDDYIQSLLAQIELLQSTRFGAVYATRTFSYMNMDVTISNVYVEYIRVYGTPDDGIFLPSRLEIIRQSLEEV